VRNSSLLKERPELGVSFSVCGTKFSVRAGDSRVVDFSVWDGVSSVDGAHQPTEGGLIASVRLGSVRSMFAVPDLSAADAVLLTVLSGDMCPGLTFKVPLNKEKVEARSTQGDLAHKEKVEARRLGFGKLVREAMNNFARMQIASPDTVFAEQQGFWWRGCSGFLLKHRPRLVESRDDVATLASLAAPPDSQDDQGHPLLVISHLLFQDPCSNEWVFRRLACTGVARLDAWGGDTTGACACCTRWARANFASSCDGAGVDAPFVQGMSDVLVDTSPRKSAQRREKEKAHLADLRRQRLDTLIKEQAFGRVSEEGAQLLHSDELLESVTTIYGEESDSVLMWKTVMANAKRRAKNGNLRGSRYPDIVIRLGVQLLAKCGRKNYEELAKIMFLPSLSTAQHHK
jgi:hypothetical protein